MLWTIKWINWEIKYHCRVQILTFGIFLFIVLMIIILKIQNFVYENLTFFTVYLTPNVYVVITIIVFNYKLDVNLRDS